MLKRIIFLPFYFLSDGIKFVDYFRISRQAILIKSKSKKAILFGKGVSIGNYRAPGFFSNSYLELRVLSQGVVIGENTVIGNRFNVISN